MSAAPIPSRMTLDEYFRMETDSLEKHEYHDGVIVSMAGTRYAHCVIVGNFIRELGNGLRGKPCNVLDGNIRVKIPRKTFYYYPDISVVCGKPQFDPPAPSETTILNPLLIVEVLSDSTERFDRGGKLNNYVSVDSLREYVLVSQHKALVEVYLRQDDGSWRFSVATGLSASVRLESIDRTIALSEIYTGVEFPPDDDV